jgi:hypothetical protein
MQDARNGGPHKAAQREQLKTKLASSKRNEPLQELIKIKRRKVASKL